MYIDQETKLGGSPVIDEIIDGDDAWVIKFVIEESVAITDVFF